MLLKTEDFNPDSSFFSNYLHLQNLNEIHNSFNLTDLFILNYLNQINPPYNSLINEIHSKFSFNHSFNSFLYLLFFIFLISFSFFDNFSLISSYFFTDWTANFFSFQDIHTLGYLLYLGYFYAILLLGILLWIVLIGILAISNNI